MTPQFAKISGQPPQRLLKRIECHNLRTDMHADSLPADPVRIRVRQIQPPRLGPAESELVLVTPGRNVRMPARLHVGIYANRNSWHRPAATDAARSLFQQN